MTRRRPRSKAPGPTRGAAFSLHGIPEISPGEARLLTRLAWAVAGLLAIALGFMVLGPHRVGDYFAETDFYGAYAEGARMVQQGRIDPARYGVIGPVYEFTLGLAGFLVHDLFLASELISLLATVGTLLLWFHLLERRAGARVGFFATLFLATNAFFFRYGYGAVTDAPAILLQAAALTLLLARGSGRSIAAAGLIAGLAFLTRYNAVYLLPAGLVAVLAGGVRAERRGRGALLFATGFLIPVVPWVAYSLSHGGAFSFQLHHNIAYEVFARARGIPWDEYQRVLQPEFQNLWDVIARDPGAVGGRLLWNVVDHVRQDAVQLLGWPVAAAALLGLGFGLRDGSLVRLWPVAVAGALLFGTLVPVFYSERYSLALLPFYSSLAAIAFASPFGALAIGRSRRAWLKPWVAVFPLAAAVLANTKLQARVLDQLPVEVLECAATLRDLKQPGDHVIARKWHIAYHGGVEPLPFPFAETLPDLGRYAHENRARWLYFSWPEAETRPQFFYLLDTTAVVPGLTPHRVTRPHPAVLYEIGPDFGRLPAWFANDTLRAWHTTYARLLVEGREPKLLHRLGSLGWALGRLDEAQRALELAVRADPRNLDVLLLLGSVLVDRGDGARARVIFERAAARSPGSVEARIGLGWAHLLSGDVRRTGELWRPLIGVTTHTATLDRMVTVYGSLGDREAEAEARAARARIGGER